MKPLSKHNALQHAWLDGEAIQKRADSNEDIWYEIDADHSWQEHSQYRIKPAEPEKAYPVTSMEKEEIESVYYDHNGNIAESLVVTANAAIRRAIDDGQVVLPHGSALYIDGIGTVFASTGILMALNARLKNDEGRDMAVAKSVRNHCSHWGAPDDNCLSKIIAGVK